jgi:hypothetical protein
MLQSKYLTQDSLEIYFRECYRLGFNYIFYNTDKRCYVLSKEKPVLGLTFTYCNGEQHVLSSYFSEVVLKDLLSDRRYIKIDEHINVVDWSQVAVDTPIFVRSSIEEDWSRRHFAKYKDGKVCAWSYGKTSWSEETFSAWKYAKLAETKD